jgi:hypothetical protein
MSIFETLCQTLSYAPLVGQSFEVVFQLNHLLRLPSHESTAK